MSTLFSRRTLAGGAIASVLALTVAGGVSEAAGPSSLSQQVHGAPAAQATPGATKNGDHGLKGVLDRLVASGKITQAQEDQILNSARTGIAHRGSAHDGAGMLRAESTAVADLFKITPAELKTQLQSGKSLHDIAAAHNVTDDALKATLTSTFKARLDAAVAATKLTAAQEQTMLTRFQERLPQLITATHTVGNRGHANGNGSHKSGATSSATTTQ